MFEEAQLYSPVTRDDDGGAVVHLSAGHPGATDPAYRGRRNRIATHLDIARMGVQAYDITHYQPLLFCAESFEHAEDVVGGFFESADDDTVAALRARNPART